MSMNTCNAPLRFYDTNTAAAVLNMRANSLRAALCRYGHYYGIRPVKRQNRMLAWPAEAIDAIARGEGPTV